jgi:hypothetical protein
MHVFSIDPGGGSYTMRFLGAPLVALVAIAVLARWRGRRRMAAAAMAGTALICLAWLGLYLLLRCTP